MKDHVTTPREFCLAALLAVLACSGLAACGSSTAARGKVLRMPLYGGRPVLDPALASTPSSRLVASLLYSGLVKFDPDLHVVPELAVSIPTISGDGHTYTFTVRQDARFADGRPCTGYDVAYSLARALSPAVHSPTARRYLADIQGAAAVELGRTSRLSGVRVLDGLTVRIHLVRPDADFLDKLALPVASVVDRRAVPRSSSVGWIGHAVGTGPWMVSGQAGNGDLELSPRPHFYGGSLGVSSLLLVPVPSAARAIDLYRRGDLDVAQVGDAQYRALSSRPDFHGSSSLDGYYALPPPSRVDEFESSLNRDELARVIGPALSPLDAIVPPAVPDYVASSLSSDSPLFGSATPPAPVTLEPSRPRDWAIGALRRALELQWPARRHAGAAVRLVHITSVVPDPAVWLRVALPQTRSRWYRDVLATGAERTNDPVTRMSSYGTAESWALQKGLVIPLASGNIGFLIKPDVSGLQVTPLGLMPENNNWPSVTLT